MLKFIIDVVITLALYLLPGLIVLSWVNFRDLKLTNRIILALVISLIIVPTMFILVGNLLPFRPSLLQWALLVGLLLMVKLILRLRQRRTSIGWSAGVEQPLPTVPSVERWMVFGFLMVFIAVVNLPRIVMALRGELTTELGPWDESWHIAELVSVARTGIPPLHYFFPSLNLGYYYASWIYPAILGNLPGAAAVSLLRAMSFHAYLQAFAFVGLFYVLLQNNIHKSWARLLGLAFVTMMGGFDLFARLPKIEFIDWWVRDLGMFGETNFQISQFSTLYSWVPHHLAAGMAFLALILVFKNMQISTPLKVICAAIALAFSFSTSAFVFLAIALAVGLSLLIAVKSLWAERKKTFIYMALLGAIFLAVTWSQIFVYSGHSGSIVYNDLRVTVIENLRGNYGGGFQLADKILSVAGLPLFASAILVIDLGLAYLLYVAWLFKRVFFPGARAMTRAEWLLTVYPPLVFLAVVLFKDQGGGLNFTMRGFIPAQILIVLGAVTLLDELSPAVERSGWRRWALGYLLLCFIVAQSLSTLAEIRDTSKKPLSLALFDDCGIASLFRNQDPGDCLPEDANRYVYWVNQNTPRDALILETGPFPDDKVVFRWMERNRFVLPAEVVGLTQFGFDADFILPDEWKQLTAQSAAYDNAINLYQAIDFRGKDRQPVYLVLRGENQPPTGAQGPLYQDAFVRVYSLENGVLNR